MDYLEKEMRISRSDLLRPLKDLLENGIILFSNEVLSDDFIKAYRRKREQFEKSEQSKSIGALVSGGRGYNYKKTMLWKDYFTDKYCLLGKEFFDELQKNKKINIKLDKQILDIGTDINPFYYFQFNLKIDKEKLSQYLDGYLSGFIQDEYNDGRKYAYAKQVQEISATIKKLISAGYSAKSLLLDNAQIFPRSKLDVRPTDGIKHPAIFLYDFLDTVLAMEKEGLLKILDIQYQKDIHRLVISSDLVWDDPIKIKVCVSNKLYQEELDVIKKTEMIFEALGKRAQQETEINNREIKEIIQPTQNKKFVYNPNTGDGQFGGKGFRLKDGTDYRKLFDACYAIKGEKLEKQKVIEILGLKDDNVGIEKIFSALGDSKTRRKPNTEVLITRAITDIAKKIRDKTGLNTQELVNNGGNIILNI